MFREGVANKWFIVHTGCGHATPAQSPSPLAPLPRYKFSRRSGCVVRERGEPDRLVERPSLAQS